MACPGRECVQDEEAACQAITWYNTFYLADKIRAFFMNDIIYKEQVGHKTSLQGQVSWIRLSIQPLIAKQSFWLDMGAHACNPST